MLMMNIPDLFTDHTEQETSSNINTELCQAVRKGDQSSVWSMSDINME